MAIVQWWRVVTTFLAAVSVIRAAAALAVTVALSLAFFDVGVDCFEA